MSTQTNPQTDHLPLPLTPPSLPFPSPPYPSFSSPSSLPPPSLPPSSPALLIQQGKQPSGLPGNEVQTVLVVHKTHRGPLDPFRNVLSLQGKDSDSVKRPIKDTAPQNYNL